MQRKQLLPRGMDGSGTATGSVPRVLHPSHKPATGMSGMRPMSAAIQRVSAVNKARTGSPHPLSRIAMEQRIRQRAASPAVQAWTSLTPSAITSRSTSVACSDEDLGILQQPVPSLHAQAWSVFNESIKQIADDTRFFANKHPQNFRSSDAFKQVLTEINYLPLLEVSVQEEDDESYLSFRPASVPGEVDDLVDATVDAEWAEQLSVLSFADDECLSQSRASGLGRRSPGVHFQHSNCATSSVGEHLSSTLEEEPDETSSVITKPVKTLLPVATICKDEESMRGELYQRYLHHPETWTDGLSKHLQRTIMRERLPASKNWHTTQIFRPKSAVTNKKHFNKSAVWFKRSQSAAGHLPSLQT